MTGEPRVQAGEPVPLGLEDAADYAAFGADGRTVDGSGLGAGEDGNDGGYFFGGFKALE